MVDRFFTNTKSLTSRLALFFTLVSTVVGVVTFLVFIAALQWSEDRVGERRILIDRDEAVQRYVAGESGRLRIDALTTAYNDLSLLPEPYREFAKGKESFVGEIGDTLDPLSQMLFVGHYWFEGQKIPIVLLTQIDRVEFGLDELIYSTSLVIGFVAALMFMFGALLYRLSQRLIEPVNSLANQLGELSGDAQQPFEIGGNAAIEFQTLTNRLNKYRTDIHSLIKREQAFSRYASHELRTPLTIIRGANGLLTKSQPSDFQHKQVERIGNASYQMGTMIDALLSLVRYEKEQDEADVRALTERELKTVIEQNSVQASSKDLELKLVVESEPMIKASSAVVNMILGNLVRNAIAATNNGSVTVTLSDSILLVEDEGEGMIETPNRDGHGLGLLIVDDFCQRYGWQFNLANREQRGCRAEIRFERFT
ncbi:HAMP domain-containing histidine kinase [Vibrio lamellibrachiae]|uniref:sensor histidine kinase n=1 Tax=Vibrio lamellibrachiae TaxID=2910253 RepID=UPI003D101BF5